MHNLIVSSYSRIVLKVWPPVVRVEVAVKKPNLWVLRWQQQLGRREDLLEACEILPYDESTKVVVPSNIQ